MTLPINQRAADHMQYGFYFAFEWDRRPDWNFDRYQIPAMTVWYILDGHRILHVGQEEYALQPGDLLVLPNQTVISTRHAMASSAPIRYLSLGMHFTIGAREWNELYSIPIQMRLSSAEDLSEWLDAWRQLARRFASNSLGPASGGETLFASASATTDYLERNALFQQWLATLSRFVEPYMAEPQPKLDQRLFHICSYIQSHYADSITAKELASRACVSEGHLRAIFRDSLQMSPYQYVIHVRLSKARQMLMSTDQTLQEIALAVGFDDLSHFISLFRRKIGVTPAHYRRESHWSV